MARPPAWRRATVAAAGAWSAEGHACTGARVTGRDRLMPEPLTGDTENPSGGPLPGSDSSAATYLGQEDFLPLALNGWGDGWNAYVHSMAWYEGGIFCGTFRANNCHLRDGKVAPPQWPVWPIRCPDDFWKEVDLRAQIWRFDSATGEWENVLKSPLVMGKHGKEIPRDFSYRGMSVFQGKGDNKPALYVTTFCSSKNDGPFILRSDDGMNFEPVSKPGLGLEGVSSFRFLTPFNGKLYTSLIGSTKHVMNASKYPIVFESEDPAGGEWRAVSEPGFGSSNNAAVFNVAAFNGWLYAATFNPTMGFELWKTDGEGAAPYKWRKVIGNGAYRGSLSQGGASLCVFRDTLYIGTGIQDGGFDRANRIGPAAGEIVRVYPDDTWDVVVGTARLTPDGLKVPVSGFGPGFNDLFNGYMWRMCVHEGRLYMGTAGWGVYLRYANKEQWPENVQRLLESAGVEEIIKRDGGFDLWSTEDGDSWTPVTVNGFGNAYNIGARNLVSTPLGLAVGTVNPFGPEVAIRNGESWNYVSNARGGIEVWLGGKALPSVVSKSTPAGGDQPAESYRLKPVQPSPRKRTGGGEIEVDLKALDYDAQRLSTLISGADPASIQGDQLTEIRQKYSFEDEGCENVPRAGGVLLVGNNPAAPGFAGGGAVPEHALLTLDAVRERRKRHARLLAPAHLYATAQRFGLASEVIDKLGCVPATRGNGVRLLQMKEAVLMYPEGRPSRPPYDMRRLEPDFVRMAWEADVPIVPVAFIGPRESHMVVEHGDQWVLVNKGRPLTAKYKATFLRAIRVRDHVQDIENADEVGLFCDLVRGRIQEVLDQQSAERPLVRMASKLQQKHGSPPPCLTAELLRRTDGWA
jgi:hypothetical protein